MICVNFQDLADLTSRHGYQPANADFLDAACRVHLDPFDESALFTWCRHFSYREVVETPIGNLCNLISLRIRDTWDVRFPGTDLELGGTLANWTGTRPLPRRLTFGDLAGVNSRSPGTQPFSFLSAQGAHLFYACHVIVRLRGLFYPNG